MPQSPSSHSFASELEVLDQALAAERGIRIRCVDWPSAETFRHRLHAARRLDRRDNQNIYQEGDPMYGKSQYDSLICRLKRVDDGGVYVYIEPQTLPTEIEVL